MDRQPGADAGDAPLRDAICEFVDVLCRVWRDAILLRVARERSV